MMGFPRAVGMFVAGLGISISMVTHPAVLELRTVGPINFTASSSSEVMGQACRVTRPDCSLLA